MAMKTLSGTCSSDLLSQFRGVFCIIRPRLASPGKVFSCCRISSSTDAPVHELFNLSVVPPTLLASERKEAKSVLTLFLMQQGLSKAVAARTITKSNHFIEHLVSRLYSAHKSGYLVGRELTTPEIRDTLNPYLQSLVEEHGNFVVDFVKNFPSAPIQKKPGLPVCRSHSSLYSKKPEAVSFVSAPGPAADLRPQFHYLLELGMDLEKIKLLTCRYPSFSYYSLEGKIKPLVEFLLDLGVPKSCIPTILSRKPSLCGHSLSKKIIPSMIYLEDLGVDKKQWAKVICRSPDLLCHSRQKVQAIVNFLHESGLSSDSIGNILTKFPAIVGYSLEDNLRPKAKYFKQLGVNAAIILCRSPVTFGHSIEGHLKPVTNFFLEREFSVEEVGTMVSRYAGLYTLSLTENVIPKWEFFPTMGYSRPELVKFPQYFSYSLEQRIKPRFALVKELGMKMVLSSMLAPSQCNFEKVLIRNRKNLLADKGSSHTENKQCSVVGNWIL